MSQKRSAEWLRGAVESHINTCNLITSITSATASHPARQGLMAAGKELHNQLDRYRALLAEAEAREASVPTAAGQVEIQKRNNLRLLTEWEKSEAKLHAAAEVIAAAERALEAWREAMNAHGEWDDGCFYYAKKSASELEPRIERNDSALAAIAKWKEANNA